LLVVGASACQEEEVRVHVIANEAHGAIAVEHVQAGGVGTAEAEEVFQAGTITPGRNS
jgi:hypothetical protein